MLDGPSLRPGPFWVHVAPCLAHDRVQTMLPERRGREKHKQLKIGRRADAL